LGPVSTRYGTVFYMTLVFYRNFLGLRILLDAEPADVLK